MKTHIAFLRGINVVGKNRLPMKELRECLEAVGATGVRTYIQSGNAVFRHAGRNAAALAKRIRAAVRDRRGFDPHVFLMDRSALDAAIAANPFPEAEAHPQSVHLWFLAQAPSRPDLETLNGVRKKSERFHLTKHVLYMHAPEGIGRSKLAQKVEKCLGVPATARNWRTVCKMRDLVESAG